MKFPEGVVGKGFTGKNCFLSLVEKGLVPETPQQIQIALLCEDGLHILLHTYLARSFQNCAQGSVRFVIGNRYGKRFWDPIPCPHQFGLQCFRVLASFDLFMHNLNSLSTLVSVEIRMPEIATSLKGCSTLPQRRKLLSAEGSFSLQEQLEKDNRERGTKALPRFLF